MGVFLKASNIAIYAFFLWNMVFGFWSRNAEKANISNAQAARQNSKIRLKAVLKLFLVMGLTWTLETISWSLEYCLGKEKVWKVTVVFDVINALQVFGHFYGLSCKSSNGEVT